MEHLIIGMLVSLGLGYLRGRSKDSRAERDIKDAAHAIIEDKTDPITDPKDAIAKAAVQLVLAERQKDLERMAAELDAERADQKRDAEAALARGREIGKGLDVTIVKPDPKPEDFKRVFPPSDDPNDEVP